MLAAGDVATAAAWNVITNDVIAFRNNSGVVPPAIRLERQTTQSIANTTDTFVTWPTEVFDTDGMYTATSDTITAQTAGIYQVNVTLEFAANSTGFRVLSLCKNTVLPTDGTKRISSNVAQAAQGGANTVLSCSCIISLVPTDTIKVHVFHSAGVSLNIAATTAPNQTTFSMAMLGATS